MTTRKTRSIVLSYADLLDPNRILVLPGGYSRVQLAQLACDWGETAKQLGAKIDTKANLRLADGTALPLAMNTRWMVPNAQLFSFCWDNDGAEPGTSTGFDVTGTLPGQYFTSFSVSYAQRVPMFIAFVVEGLDAPDGRVAVLSPALQAISNGSAGTIFNVVDKNLKIRLIDPWGNIIINPTFTATFTLLE